jgi:DNA-binding transcriptional LysR family regulator
MHFCRRLITGRDTDMFDWTDLRYFLELHRTGRLNLAARRAGVDQTTVARRIQALERSVGTQLFDHTTAGYRLTEAGLKLLPHAEAMESTGIAIEEEIAGRDYAISGLVRIGATEGVGSHFLAQRLPAFNERLPDVEVDLISLPRFVNLSNREADIAIGQERPLSGRLVASKLTDYVLKLYAAPGYLARHAPITALKDLDGHAFVTYVDDLLYTKELRYLDSVCRAPRLALKSTSILAQYYAATAGAGLAILPAFLVPAESRLEVVLEGEVQLTRSYWMSTRSEMIKLARVRAAWDFLKELVEREQDLLMGRVASALQAG